MQVLGEFHHDRWSVQRSMRPRLPPGWWGRALFDLATRPPTLRCRRCGWRARSAKRWTDARRRCGGNAVRARSGSRSRSATRRAARWFEGRSDYAAIGAVTNLAARLAHEATAGKVLVAQTPRGDRGRDRGWSPSASPAQGVRRPILAFNLIAVRQPAGNVPPCSVDYRLADRVGGCVG